MTRFLGFTKIQWLSVLVALLTLSLVAQGVALHRQAAKTHTAVCALKGETRTTIRSLQFTLQQDLTTSERRLTILLLADRKAALDKLESLDHDCA